MDFEYIVNNFIQAISYIIPVLAALGLIYFLYGLVLFLNASGDESKRTDGKKYIIYGVVGLFVLFAFWGLVEIVSITFFEQGVLVPIIRI